MSAPAMEIETNSEVHDTGGVDDKATSGGCCVSLIFSEATLNRFMDTLNGSGMPKLKQVG